MMLVIVLLFNLTMNQVCYPPKSCIFLPMLEQHRVANVISDSVPLESLMLSDISNFDLNRAEILTDGYKVLLFQSGEIPGASMIQESIWRYPDRETAKREYNLLATRVLSSGTNLDPIGMGSQFGEESVLVWRNVSYEGFLAYELVAAIREERYVILVDVIGESTWMNEDIAKTFTERAMRPWYS